MQASVLAILCYMETQLPSPKGHNPHNFRPICVVPKWLDGLRWYGGRPRPRQICARLRPSFPSQKWGGGPQFSAHVYGGQTAGWNKMALGMEVGLGPGHIVLYGDQLSSPKKSADLPNFRPMSIVAKQLDGFAKQ